jgi:hypothetical protein
MRTPLILLLSAATLASFARPDSEMSRVSVSISPSQADVAFNLTQQFKAMVSGTADRRVNWSVLSGGTTNYGLGSINGVGLYTAPANAPSPPFVRLRATSVADPTVSATATVIVRDIRNYTQSNADDDLDVSAYNNGLDISFGWTELPFGAAKIVICRGPTISGPWTEVLIDEYPMDLRSSGRIEYTDLEVIPPDTTIDYFYKMDAFSATNLLLKSYAPVFLPKFVRDG